MAHEFGVEAGSRRLVSAMNGVQHGLRVTVIFLDQLTAIVPETLANRHARLTLGGFGEGIEIVEHKPIVDVLVPADIACTGLQNDNGSERETASAAGDRAAGGFGD